MSQLLGSKQIVKRSSFAKAACDTPIAHAIGTTQCRVLMLVVVVFLESAVDGPLAPPRTYCSISFRRPPPPLSFGTPLGARFLLLLPTSFYLCAVLCRAVLICVLSCLVPSCSVLSCPALLCPVLLVAIVSYLAQFAIPHVTRTDERVMQVHSMLRRFLERDPQTRGRDLAVQVPVVVPITPRM